MVRVLLYHLESNDILPSLGSSGVGVLVRKMSACRMMGSILRHTGYVTLSRAGLRVGTLEMDEGHV